MDLSIKKTIGIIAALIFCLCLPIISLAAESDTAARYLLREVPDPICDSVGGEWTVAALAGSVCNVPESYYERYYDNLEKTVRERKGVLDAGSYTEYSRVVIALSAIGKNAHNVAGYDLAEPLKDYSKVTEQGLNGAVYALIAIDKGGYAGPRQRLREYILSRELPKGGWNYMGKGEPDPDMTAMAVQALSRYRFLKNVDRAIDRAMPVLTQKDYGSSESISQVIIARDSLGMPPDGSLKKQLLKYMLDDGSFKHSLDDDEGNIMSTEQALTALSVF